MAITSSREPRTPTELLAAAIAASHLMILVDARTFGLVDADGQVNWERCEDILARARRIGAVGTAPAAEAARPAPVQINISLVNKENFGD